MITKLEKILTGLKIFKQDKKFLKNLIKGGRSIASYQLNIAIKTYCKDINTIFDVGANKGQFAVAASAIFPDSDIYSFEPVPEVFEDLKKNTFDINKIHSFNIALGSDDGIIKFYKNKYSHASSALPIHENQKKLIPETSETEIITVKVKKLQTFQSLYNFRTPIILKLDVQGFEKEVILGAGSFINKIDYILLEASFTEMYVGEPLFDELYEFVKGLGFKFIAPVGYLQTSTFQILQMDLLFKREEKKL